jgi:O-methyltransferase involved in polyketide biosynthesis
LRRRYAAFLKKSRLFEIPFGLWKIAGREGPRAKDSISPLPRSMLMLRLTPTAALVMRWAMPIYERSPALRFIKRLDLSVGEQLYSACNAICPWYGEVIQNRKYFIKKIIERQLDIQNPSQLLVLAAGQSPLALELALERPSQIGRAFEADASGMEGKARLYDETFPEAQGKLQCLAGDITSEGLLPLLERAGYARDKASIVLFEGITYYLPKPTLQELISRFGSGGKNIIIIEYLLPCSRVYPSRRQVPKEIFALIGRSADRQEISCYTRDELGRIFSDGGGELLEGWTMREMELARCKRNRYFPGDGLGWIECVMARI